MTNSGNRQRSGHRIEGQSSRFVLVAMACLMGLWLVGCRNSAPQDDPVDAGQPERVPEEEAAETDSGESNHHRRRIADWLYEGLRAMREDRLMTPPDESAHAWFSQVLALEPGNELALEGLQDITVRYIELAELSARQGQFANAEQFLRRAGLVDPDHPGIEAGRDRLALERERTHSVHTLDGGAVAQRNAAPLATELDRVEELLSGNMGSLYLVITAPDDEQGRWIYGLVRERLGVQRLPGDIEIGGQPSIRLVNRG
ncbi:MAG: hypothetical protein WEB57_01890 [Pseudohongiellaceae bacterium]